MSNLTAREKGFMYVITLLIIVVLGYFFGIRTLNNKYEEYKQELQTLQERKAYLDEIRANNASMAAEIELLKSSCSDLELSFIDKLETECLQQYVLKTFEDEKCPFLVSVGSSDVGMTSVSYPDGTTSPDGLVCTQISVTYSSTDGYLVTQYNRNDDLTAGAAVPARQTIDEQKDMLGQAPYDVRRGYNEFISALKKINAENPSCIKVDSISVKESNGAITLAATINFYGTSLRNRLSVDDSKAPYTYWNGHTNVDCSGGFIGFPYICDNEKSMWYQVVNFNLDNTAGKPFATYWSNILFREQLEENDNDIRKVVGVPGEEQQTAETTPAEE